MKNEPKSLVHVLNINQIFFYNFSLQKLLSTINARIFMSKIYHVIIIAVLLLILLSCSGTQDIGKVYTDKEANQLFGTVIYSSEIPKGIVTDLLSKTNKVIMFGIINKTAVVIDNNRKLLYPKDVEYKDTDVFTAYSISTVKDLISKSGSESINVEQRREVLSVSSGLYTLESGTKCPPKCD